VPHTRQWHERVILCLETPLEHADVLVDWKRLVGNF